MRTFDRRLAGTALLSLLIPALAYAQERWPGADRPLSEAVAAADLIVVAEVVSLGEPSPEAPGQTLHARSTARVLERLLGRGRRDRLTFDLFVQTLPAELAERAPQVGERCILVLSSRGRTRPRVLQAMPMTDQNRAQVQAAIAARAH